jgi:hypothetical protein
MNIVLGTWSSEDFNADCDYALVALTPDLATRILQRMDVVERLQHDDSAVREVLFWDCSPEFFVQPEDEQLLELLPADGDSYQALPAGQQIPDDAFQRTEGAVLVIGKHGQELEAHWRATPKHVAIYVSTASLPRSFIEKTAQFEVH